MLLYYEVNIADDLLLNFKGAIFIYMYFVRLKKSWNEFCFLKILCRMRKLWVSRKRKRIWVQMGKADMGKDWRTSIKNVWKWALGWTWAQTNRTGSTVSEETMAQYGPGYPQKTITDLHNTHINARIYILYQWLSELRLISSVFYNRI